jgi:hypothetical protein
MAAEAEASMVVEASMAEAAGSTVEAFTAAAFTVVDSMVVDSAVGDFMAAVFMPFAPLRAEDAISARSAPNSTPPAPATRAFRNARFHKAWSRAVTPTQAVQFSAMPVR